MEHSGSLSGEYEYRTLMSMMHVSVSKHLLNDHFTMVWANDYYYDLIGYSRLEYEALYQNQCDRYYDNNREEWNKIVDIVSDTLNRGQKEYSLITKMRRKGGEDIWVRMAGTFMQEYIDGCQVSYTVITNVNDIIQMKAEQSVTYDSLPGFVGKFSVDKDLRITLLDANERFTEFFGEECGKNRGKVLTGRNLERNAEKIEERRGEILAGEPVHFMTRMRGWRGEDAWLQINAACVDWQEGNPVYLAIFIDVTNETELRRMQEQLKEQARQLSAALEMAERANRAKSDFLSHMSHDIRTPMNAIIGMTDIAQAHLDDPAKMQDCLKKISISSQHLLGLINDVLDMSRIESGKITINNSPFSLPNMMEKIVAIMQPGIKSRRQQFSIRLRKIRHENFCSDALHLRQIFINILSNASKFTPEKGKISMEVEERESDEAGMALVQFTFTDSGIGMKPEFLQNLFEPFTREQDSRVDKTEGSGLGMAITKKLVDLLGGTIEVQSREGEGTTFFVTMPMQIEEELCFELKFPNLRILVVDDDVTMCEHMVQSLRQIGVCVDTAGTGFEAVAIIEEAYRQGERYDGVFLDWKMPGMDGPETARRIRSLTGKELPILIVSAYDWGDIEEEAGEAGINGFIPKPMFISTLCQALRKYVMKEQTEEAVSRRNGGAEFAGKHFLLVEDNDLNREIVVEMLSSSGAEMEYACNGAEGVEKFRQSPREYYDLILMDVQMPVMNGYEATRIIRTLPRADAAATPIIAMTADAFAEDINKAKAVGMNGHLAKPLDMETLKREILEILRRKK